MARKSDPTRQATAQRRRVNTLYTQSVKPINDGLAQIERVIQEEIDRQLREADAAIRAGRKVGPNFFTGARADRLRSIIEREMQAWTATATLNTTLAQDKAARLAVDDAVRALAGAGAKDQRPPVPASRGGRVASGKTTVGALYQAYPRVMADMVSDAMTKAVSATYSKRRVKSKTKGAINTVRVRALTTVKTEMFTIYRDTLQSAYRASKDVAGWVWVSRLSKNTCPICWTRHGSFHRTSEKFASHPNCQCVPMPFTAAKPPAIASGLDLFRQLSVGEQQRILGPGRWRQWDAGKLPWESMVIKRRHPVYGNTLRLAPITKGGRRSKPTPLAYSADQLRSKPA